MSMITETLEEVAQRLKASAKLLEAAKTLQAQPAPGPTDFYRVVDRLCEEIDAAYAEKGDRCTNCRHPLTQHTRHDSQYLGDGDYMTSVHKLACGWDCNCKCYEAPVSETSVQARRVAMDEVFVGVSVEAYGSPALFVHAVTKNHRWRDIVTLHPCPPISKEDVEAEARRRWAEAHDGEAA